MAIICWQSMISGVAAAASTSKNVAQQVLGSKLMKKIPTKLPPPAKITSTKVPGDKHLN